MNGMHRRVREGSTCEGPSSKVPHGAFPKELNSAEGTSSFFGATVLPYIAVKADRAVDSDISEPLLSNFSGSSSSPYGLKRVNSRPLVMTAMLLLIVVVARFSSPILLSSARIDAGAWDDD